MSTRRTVIGYHWPPENAGIPASFSSLQTAAKLRVSAYRSKIRRTTPAW